MNLELVQIPGIQALLNRLCAASNRNIFIARGLPRLLHGAVDAVGHKNKRRSAFFFDSASRMRSQDKHWCVEGRIVSPPSVFFWDHLPMTRARR